MNESDYEKIQRYAMSANLCEHHQEYDDAITWYKLIQTLVENNIERLKELEPQKDSGNGTID